MKMKLAVLFTLFIAVLGCRPQAETTEWNITVAPQSGVDAKVQTDMNTAVDVAYSIPEDEEAVALELVIVSPPLHGILKDCVVTSLSISCKYIPHDGYVGLDKISFLVKDGDFESDKVSELIISVNPVEGIVIEPIPVDPPAPPAPAPTVENVVIKCEEAIKNGKVLTAPIVVNFPAAIECNFNEAAAPDDFLSLNLAGNGSRKDGKIRARDEQVFKANLPANAIICDLNFNFPLQAMKYDDEIFLTVNNYVIMSSQNYSAASGAADYANGFKTNALGLMEYKWLAPNGLYNLRYGQQITPKYCLGVNPLDPLYNDKCSLPPTDTLGQIKLDIPSTEIIKLALAKPLGEESTQATIDFGFITTGDNDNGDCEHSAYSFEVSVQYIDKASYVPVMEKE